MAKDPRFNFYPDNYEGGTDFFTLEQDGAYIRLFILQFRYGQFTEKQAIQKLMTRCADTPHKAAELWNSLKHKYETDGTNFWNYRLRSEIEKSKKQSEDQADRANKRWGKESGTSPAYAGALPEVAQPPADAFSSSSNLSSNSKTTSTKKSAEAPPVEKFNPFDFIPDTWDRTEFMECWTAHMEVRRKRKNPATTKACELILSQLVKACPVWSDARQKMEASIVGGWPKYIYEDSGRTAKVIRPREKQQADYKGGFGQL